MKINRTRLDPRRGPKDAGRPATYRNVVTQWWDGLQMYGSCLGKQTEVRTGPDCALTANCISTRPAILPLDPNPPNRDPAPGCGRKRELVDRTFRYAYAVRAGAQRNRRPLASRVSGQGRRMAVPKSEAHQCGVDRKIHATEWSPCLAAKPNPAIRHAGRMVGRAGGSLLQGVRAKVAQRVLDGIPGSPQEHHSGPYAITEEFVAVYRLHSLIPDAFSFWRHTDHQEVLARTLADLFAGGTTRLHQSVPFDDVLYSLGTSYCGLPGLHNYPVHLRKLSANINQGMLTDVAATDILRDRERASLVTAHSDACYDERTRDLRGAYRQSHVAARARTVYRNVSGSTYSPGRSPKHGHLDLPFDTAFRIFIVMAGRRSRAIDSDDRLHA